MFERVKVDNVSSVQLTSVPAEVTLDDAQTMRGKFFAPQGRGIYDLLNGANAFLEFEPYGGDRCLLAKRSIKSVRLVNVPVASQLSRRTNDLDTFDPYAILGIKSGASFDEVKVAYYRLAKVYHPDRYSAAELPAEVRDYLAAMVRRINAAFAAIEVPHQEIKKAIVERAEPIYTSRPRA